MEGCSNGYVHYILAKNFFQKPLKFFWQDIMCKFWKGAQKSDKNFCSQQIKPAVSVMHSKAHNWTCQVLYSNSFSSIF